MIKSVLLKFLIIIVKKFKPLIRLVAEHADISIHTPKLPNGQNPLIFLDDITSVDYNTPKSVKFNTRSGKIIVGKNTVFGEQVMVLTGKHNFISDIVKIEDLHQVPLKGRDIEIGNNCYIGSGAIILGPVKIGDYSVICAGAVVTKDVMPYEMVGGVPSKLIKKLK